MTYCYLFSFPAPNRSWERAGFKLITWLIAGNLRLVVRVNRAEAQNSEASINCSNELGLYYSQWYTFTGTKGTFLASIRLEHGLRYYLRRRLRLIPTLTLFTLHRTHLSHYITYTHLHNKQPEGYCTKPGACFTKPR